MPKNKGGYTRHRQALHMQNWRFFLLEEIRCREKFPNFRVARTGKIITVKGTIQPDGLCRSYDFLIKYKFLNSPEVWIVNPDIEYDFNIHMYKDSKQLCLFHPTKAPWKPKYSLSDTIIPWTCAWLLYYELWLLTGTWQGEEADHGPPVEIEVNE